MVESVIELLKSYDPEVGEAVDAELHRQRRGLELIASENLVSEDVRLARRVPASTSMPRDIRDTATTADANASMSSKTLQ